MKWGIFLLLGATVFASEGAEAREDVAEGNDNVGKDVGTDTAREDDHENEDDIEHIEDIDELQNIINRKEYVLTYFFHPSCYPCMDFVPEFDKIPGRVKDLPWAEGIEFVKVNMAGNEDEIGKKYNIKGYPWINFYKNGKAVQFKGRRHVPKIVTFMFQRITQAFKHITDTNEAKVLVQGGVEDVEVMMINYFDEGAPEFEILESMSDDYYRIKFVKVTDKEVAAAFGLKKKGVAIVRPAIQEVVNYLPGKVSKEALISFLEDYGTPLIIDYNEDTSMVVFEDKQPFHMTLLLPDPKDEAKNQEKMAEYYRAFREVAVRHERTGNGRDSLFILSETDNAENFRLMTFYDLDDDEVPTYRIMDTRTHNKYGIQYTRGKDMKHEKMWEVFQSARNGSEKYLICEGTPDDFYDREIMYLTGTVLQQNLETKLPHLILFHDGTNDLEMKLLDELSELFPYEKFRKAKKKKFPRLATYNLARNVILDHPYAQRLYGMKPKAGQFFLFRGTERIIKWEGNLELEEIAEWAKAKSKKKLDEEGHDEL